eukprot:2719869-Pleurochrysis_carterae.AAC.2
MTARTSVRRAIGAATARTSWTIEGDGEGEEEGVVEAVEALSIAPAPPRRAGRASASTATARSIGGDASSRSAACIEGGSSSVTCLMAVAAAAVSLEASSEDPEGLDGSKRRWTAPNRLWRSTMPFSNA